MPSDRVLRPLNDPVLAEADGADEIVIDIADDASVTAFTWPPTSAHGREAVAAALEELADIAPSVAWHECADEPASRSALLDRLIERKVAGSHGP